MINAEALSKCAQELKGLGDLNEEQTRILDSMNEEITRIARIQRARRVSTLSISPERAKVVQTHRMSASRSEHRAKAAKLHRVSH